MLGGVARIAYKAPAGVCTKDSIIAISHVGFVILMLGTLGCRILFTSHVVKNVVPHDTIQGVWLCMMCLIWKRRFVPTNLLNHYLVGRYGIMPNKYVRVGCYECTCVKAVSVSSISEKGGLKHIALPTSWCKWRKKECKGVYIVGLLDFWAYK